MDWYRVKTVSSDEEAQRWLNEMKAEGYEFLSMTASGWQDANGTGILLHLVVEYRGKQTPAEVPVEEAALANQHTVI
ncbi:MAG TPA: hypothetical protein VFB38_24520 [Chthonomonadaceae bacterium]|nr:hypothetical protein [Chthonomonadaceae bacterium]